MDGDISAPPQEVVDCLAALQAVADLRPHRRDASVLRKVLLVSGADNGTSPDAVAKATKSPQGSASLSLPVPQH
jgi:hypothetical protein